MWFQYAIVFAVVACSAVFVARSLLRRVAGKSGACSGCGGCAQTTKKACLQPVVFHPTQRTHS